MLGKVLVTGGCGYIGSHIILELILRGIQVISIDNNFSSNLESLSGIRNITGVEVKNYQIDLCNQARLVDVFLQHEDIVVIVHCAGYKMASESFSDPVLYYENNIVSTINILKCMKQFNVNNLIFSSSCSVYGLPLTPKVSESSLLQTPSSPYAFTKQVGEKLLQDHAIANTSFKGIALRYFNPAGYHHSNKLGKVATTQPDSLIQALSYKALGKLEDLLIYGGDCSTPDGSAVRDYIHITDLAVAHIKVIEVLINKSFCNPFEVFNIGSGTGMSVFEVLESFEKVCKSKLIYSVQPLRPGDIECIYADITKATVQLEWTPEYSLIDILETTWAWEAQC